MNHVVIAELFGRLLEPIGIVIAVGLAYGLAATTRRRMIIWVVGSVVLALLLETLGYKEVGEVWGDNLPLNFALSVIKMGVVTLIVMRIKNRKVQPQDAE